MSVSYNAIKAYVRETYNLPADTRISIERTENGPIGSGYKVLAVSFSTKPGGSIAGLPVDKILNRIFLKLPA